MSAGHLLADDEGRPVVDVAEVWALGARSDSAVCAEMRDRVAILSASPVTLPLAGAIERLGKIAAGTTPRNTEPRPQRIWNDDISVPR